MPGLRGWRRPAVGAILAKCGHRDRERVCGGPEGIQGFVVRRLPDGVWLSVLGGLPAGADRSGEGVSGGLFNLDFRILLIANQEILLSDVYLRGLNITILLFVRNDFSKTSQTIFIQYICS